MHLHISVFCELHCCSHFKASGLWFLHILLYSRYIYRKNWMHIDLHRETFFFLPIMLHYSLWSCKLYDVRVMQTRCKHCVHPCVSHCSLIMNPASDLSASDAHLSRPDVLSHTEMASSRFIFRSMCAQELFSLLSVKEDQN